MAAHRCPACKEQCRDSIAAFFHCYPTVMVPEHPKAVNARAV